MDTRRLKAFIAVVELGSLTRAAERLGTTQPSLSQQIMDLEAQFGVPLLVRTSRGVTATPAGDLLCRHAHIILRQLDQASLELRRSDKVMTGAITVGLPGSLAPILAVPLLAKVRARYPDVSLRIVGGSYVFLSDLTANGRVDLALSAAEPAKGVKAEALFSDELVLVSPPSFDSLLGPDELELHELNGHPLILPISWGVDRAMVYDEFNRNGLVPEVVGELESVHDLLTAAREGHGSTILRWAAAAQLAPDLRIRRITNPRLTRTVYLAEPALQPTTAPTTAIKALIRELTHELISQGRWKGAVLPTERP